MTTRRATRHAALALPLALAAAVGLAACSSGEDTDPPAGDAPAGDTHELEHAHGTTAVPEDPQRVVVLEPVQLDTAVAMGVTPVGAAVANEELGVPAYLGDEAADIATVGTVAEPNVQKVAALEPDLIIGTESRHAALYDQLSDVAPTVFMASQADPWKDNVAFTAAALGDPDAGDELLAEYEQRCDEIAGEYDTEGMTAQLIRPRDGVLTLYGPTSFAGSTLECAGLTIPEHDWEDISLDISPEKVLDAKADVVPVTVTDVADASEIPAAVSDNADQLGGVVPVDFQYWIAGVGPVGGLAVLDDLEEILAAQS